MIVKNQTSKMVVCENLKIADGFQEKSQGLIGSDEKTGLFLKTRFGAHTFGMTFPIDIIILDNKNRVVAHKKELRPNRIFFWNPLRNKVIEIPSAIIPEGIVSIGDEISIINNE